MTKKIAVSRNSTVEKNNDLLSSNMDGEVVLLSIANSQYYGMDKVGSRIWELIDEPIKVSKIVQSLLNEYEVEESVCEHDVIEFLKDLNEQNLIHITG